MRIFKCIIDDGKDVFKTIVACKNKKEVLTVYGGNGKFEKVTDVTKNYFTEESVDRLRIDLRRTGWGAPETELICALLQEHIRKIKKQEVIK